MNHDFVRLRLRGYRRGAAFALALGLAFALPLRAQVPDAARPVASAASDASASTVTAPAPEGAALLLNQRPIATFRATLMGRTPTQRVALGQVALATALERGGPGHVAVWQAGDTAGLQVDGAIVFYLVAGDLDPGSPANLAGAAEAVRQRLQAAVLELREMDDPRRIATGTALSLLAIGLAWIALRIVFAVRRLAVARAGARLARWQSRHPVRGVVGTYAQHGRAVAQAATTLLAWGAAVLLVDLCLTYVLGQFAITRPWAERSTQWLLGFLAQFARAVADALPGLLTVALIFVVARLVARANASVMGRVERGELVLGWLDADTAGPTRRVGNFVVWLFALAIAYPFLPGANSEAFKGVSVLAGLTLSFGASGVVGQVVSGLSLMYSRTLRVGEYVKIGETEGTVALVGMFATRIQTGLGEEVSLPNAFIFGQPVRNFSRLVQDGQFVLHTAVTIGYATPWRQVHAMLREAARRAVDVSVDPAPYVVQTALSDFYVEYRLCAQSRRSAPRRRAETMSQLHAHIQDVFNENGVQIMSPHYLADPPTPQVVPPAGWAPGLAPAADAPPVPRPTATP